MADDAPRWKPGAAEVATARAAVGHPFCNGRRHRVETRCGVEHHATLVVADRPGFRAENAPREGHWLMDRVADHAWYGMLEAEWPQCVARNHGAA